MIGDRETKTKAIGGRTREVGAIEAVKDMGKILRRNADTLVFDAKFNGVCEIGS